MNKKTIIIVILLIFILSNVSYGMVKPVFIDYGNGKLITLNNPIIKNGRVYVPIRQITQAYGATVDYYKDTKRIQIELNNISTQFYLDSYYVIVNGIKNKMDTTPVVVEGVTMVPLRFLSNYLEIEVLWNEYSRLVKLNPPKDIVVSQEINNLPLEGKIDTNRLIVLDPGHGGTQSGAVYDGVSEKDLNLDIALYVNQMLKDSGIKTILTRGSDKTVSLQERCNIANSNNADVFISIHNNAHPYIYSYSGTEILYNPNRNINSLLTNYDLSTYIRRELINNANIIDRGLKIRDDLYVLNNTKMPAVLVEVEYMTNKNALDRLKTDDFKKQVATGITKGIINAILKIN